MTHYTLSIQVITTVISDTRDHILFLDKWRNVGFDKSVSDVLVGFDKDFNFTKLLKASRYDLYL